MLKNIILLLLTVAVASSQYYSIASSYPYLTGAYAPSPLAGGEPATVLNSISADPVPVASAPSFFYSPPYNRILG